MGSRRGFERQDGRSRGLREGIKEGGARVTDHGAKGCVGVGSREG